MESGPPPRLPDPAMLREWLGEMDIYLLDLVLKGRIIQGMRVLDAGCGRGRNLVYFLRWGLEVYGVDGKEENIRRVRALAADLAPHLPAENFRREQLENMSFGDAAFDAVISNAVLHFAENDQAFRAMLVEIWRVLRPGGLFFCRVASRSGIEDLVEPLAGRRCRLPDGSTRYVVDDALLLQYTEQLEGTLVEPIKTVHVSKQRSMATWVLRKAARP